VNAKIVTVHAIPVIVILLCYTIITSNLTFATNNKDQHQGQRIMANSSRVTNGDCIGDASVLLQGLPGQTEPSSPSNNNFHCRFSILIPGIGNGTAIPVFDLVRDSYELIITGLLGETHLGFVSFDSFGPEPSVSRIDIPGIGTGTAMVEQNLEPPFHGTASRNIRYRFRLSPKERDCSCVGD